MSTTSADAIDHLIPDPELFSSFLEISSEAIWVMDVLESKTIWYASPANQLKYAITDEKDFWANNLHPEERDRIVAGFQHALADKQTLHYEHSYHFRGKNQEYFFIKDKLKFIRNVKGQPLRVVGVWQDTTDVRKRQQKLERALQALEADRLRFKHISEVSNLAMWEMDFMTGLIIWTSGSKALSEFGLTKPNYHLKDREDSIYPEDRQRVLENFNFCLNSKQEKYFDAYRVLKADHSIAHIIDQGTILRDETGKAIRGLGGWIDISREREREQVLETALEHQRKLNKELEIRKEELLQLNEQLSVNLEVLSEREFILTQSQRLAKVGSWEYDINTDVIFWSEEMYNIYGIDKTFDINDREEILKLYESTDLPLVDQMYRSLKDSGSLPFDIMARVNTPIGYRKWVRITGYPQSEEGRFCRVLGLVYDITFFKEAEERLRLSEEKFAKAFSNNPDLMVITREGDMVIFDVNEKVYPVLGYTRDEVVGHNSFEFSFFVNAADRENFFTQYNSHGFAELECQWKRKDGYKIHIMLTSSRIELNGAKFFITVIKDISDRKTAEERFQKSFALSPDLMLIIREHDMKLIDANTRLEEVSGYTHDEVLGKVSSEFDLWVIPEERQRYFTTLNEKGHIVMEALFRKKNGAQFYGIISANRMELSEENHIIVIIKDVTEKKKSEEKLRLSEANLNATINNTEIMIWSIDRSFNLLTYNQAFRDFIEIIYDRKLSIGSLIFASPRNEIEQDTRDRWKERYMRALAGEIVKIEELRWDRYFQFSLSPIIENNLVTGVSVFAEDVSERVERDRLLSEANTKIGEFKLMALRSVMNPHFIFNALNSIQYFIAQNDRRNAISYLSTFSKLIRSILNNSVHNKIKLAEELEQIKYYIELELVRFDNKFDFVLDIDPELDVESINIPSLLIQPYVENAILHGLYNKNDRGALKISVYEKEDSVLFEIEDDGVGREMAMKIRQQNFPKHKSMGTALTEERLKLINAQDVVSFEIVDLMKDGQPAGTKVKIWVKS
jgi:PAS domain S-box-containing protein